VKTPAPLLALAFTSTLFAAAPDWPRFRGPNGSGLGGTLSLPEKPTAADVRWKTKLPAEGHSSPVIVGDRIFVTCAEKATGKRTLVCVSAKDGKIVWTMEFTGPVFREHADNSFASATPAVDAERVYLCSFSPEGSWLAAFAQQDGKELWKKELGNFVSQHGPGASPMVWEDLVIVDFDQDQPKSFVAAWDGKSGAEKWRWDKPGDKHSSSTPCIFTPKSGAPQVVTISNTVGVTGLDARTGKVAWQVAGLLPKRCVASPIVTAGGLIVTQCGEGQAESFVHAVKVADDGKSAQSQYEVRRTGGYVPTPVAVGDLLFLWKENGLVTCLRAANNEQVWSERVQGPFYASPIAVAGRLYNVTRKGELVVVSATDKFSEIARFDLGEASFATPAVSGGRLYLRTMSQLMALGK
jgi:outer membrane protein assembly factor BamB